MEKCRDAHSFHLSFGPPLDNVPGIRPFGCASWVICRYMKRCCFVRSASRLSMSSLPWAKDGLLLELGLLACHYMVLCD